MGDSTATTVEFLRARLLSERSVSRSERQRADQLAKRVAELEEQLRIVTSQRRKAEKAAAEVVSILESQGLGDLSEVVDSSSEQDVITCRPNDNGDTLKEDESSTGSRMDRSEVDDGHSGSEPEVSPTQCGSLSWKGNSNGQDSVEKKFHQSRQRQRRSSYVYAVGSSKGQHAGKSCRKNKRKETGCTVETPKTDSNSNDFRGQEDSLQIGDIPSGFGNCPDISDGSLGSNEDKACNLVTSSADEQSKDSSNSSQENGECKHEKIEQALEKKAQNILLYQEEEILQRQWEEKFEKNNCSMMVQDLMEERKVQDLMEERKTETACNGNELKDDMLTILPGETLSPNKELNSCIAMTVADMHDDKVSAPKTDNLGSAKGHTNKEQRILTISNSFSIRDDNMQCSEHAAEIDSAGSRNQSERKDNSTKSTPLECSAQDFEFPDQVALSGMVKDNVHFLQDNSDVVSSYSSLQPLVNGSVNSSFSESPSSNQSSHRYAREQLHTPAHHSHKRGLEVLEKDNVHFLQENSDVASSYSSLQPLVNGFVKSSFNESPCSNQSSHRYAREQLRTPTHQSHKRGFEVLEALRLAKLSLKQELDSPIPNKATCTSSTKYNVSVNRKDILNIPIGSTAGLFRLPTDPLPGFPQSDFLRPTHYNSSNKLDSLPCSDVDSACNSQRTLGRYPDVGSDITPAINDLGPQVGPSIKIPAYASMYSSATPSLQTSRDSYDEIQTKYVNRKGGSLTRSQYSISGIGRLSHF